MRLDHDVVCFGKLPVHGDFVRYNADSSAARDFDTWFREGLHTSRSRLGARLKPVAREAVAHRFVFCPTTAPFLLLGVMKMSRDATGRTYPFMVATEMPRGEWGGASIAHLPVASTEFLDAAEALVEDAVAGRVPRGDLPDRLRAIDPGKAGGDAVGQYEATRFLDLMTFKGLAEGIWGDYDDSRKYLLFSNLTDALRPFRGRIPARCSLGLRFPLAPLTVRTPGDPARGDGVPGAAAIEAATHGEPRIFTTDTPAEVVVGFWLRVIHAMVDLQTVAPSFFWRAWPSEASRSGGDLPEPWPPERPPGMLYFFRPPPPYAFTYLLPGTPPEDAIRVLEAAAGRTAATAALALAQPVGETLEREAASLHDVIDCVRT